ncbi:MAG: DUF4129 domain-containing protein [Methanophagales archaeon]|nr:DUF4129 domain-containing protein [Methanophagales archaeon]
MRTRARAKKRKREVAALTLFIVLLFLSPVSAGGVRHQIYSEASSSDEGIHSFFSDILKEAGNCMDNFLEESPDADKFASSLESKIKVTEEESRFYAAKGVESNVSWVLKPFSALSGGVKKITSSQVVFITNYEILKNESDYEAYVRARTAVVNTRTGADEINASLDGIEKIELWNETSTLAFNVSELREKLKDVYALIDYYEKLLEKYELEAPAFEEYLLVVVSNDHPFLYEEITIYIYAKNVTSLSLFIDDICYKLKNQTEQTKKHRFEEQGEHKIYAEGIIRDGEIIKSDIVKVYVSKIPTFITLSSKYVALLNERVKIAGLLVDYFGNPLHAANVTVKAGEEETELTADRRGYFYFHGTKSSEEVLNVTAFYPGNDTYKSSSANISIFFSRFPVSLHIEANKTHINVNETVNFTGSVYGISPNYTAPLIIFVNDTSVKTLTATKDFNFSLFFSRPEIYEVYTFFPGDSVYKPAKSNVIKITVTEKAEVAGKRVEGINLLFYLLLILVAIISFFAGLYARTLKRKLHAFGEKLHIPPVFSCTRLHSRTSKGKMKALRSKLHVFKEKILTPIASIFTVIYARVFKGKFYAFSKSKNKLRALMQKKRTEQNETIENLRIDTAEEKVEEEKEQYEEVSGENILEGVDLEGAYKLLFDTIVDKYGFKKSLTPRELLEAIKKKKEPLAERLEGVTELYEKAVYGNVELADEEKESYFELIKEILSLEGMK